MACRASTTVRHLLLPNHAPQDHSRAAASSCYLTAMSPPEPIQRVSRLTALHEIEARIDAIAAAVAPREIDVAEAAGCVLAADAVAGGPLPQRAVALSDGWAVAAERVADAGAYASVPLVPTPK